MYEAAAGTGSRDRPGGSGTYPAGGGYHLGAVSDHRLVPGERVTVPERGSVRVRVGQDHLWLHGYSVHRQVLSVWYVHWNNIILHKKNQLHLIVYSETMEFQRNLENKFKFAYGSMSSK